LEYLLAKQPTDPGRRHLMRGDESTKAGDLSEGRAHYEAALTAFLRPSFRVGEGHAWRGLAVISLAEGEPALTLEQAQMAKVAYTEALAGVLKVDWAATKQLKVTNAARDGLAQVLLLGSEALIQMGREGEAEAWLKKALDEFRAVKPSNPPAGIFIALGRLALRNGQMKAAEVHFRGALNAHKSDADRQGEVRTLILMADVHRRQLKLSKAEEALNLARSIALRLPEPLLQARVWMSLGALHLQAMRLEKARAAYHRALPIFQSAGRTGREAAALLGLGEVESREGDPKALETLLAGAKCSVQEGNKTATLAALLRLAEHGLRVGEPRLALMTSECARRMGRERDQVVTQGLAMRLIVKSMAALRESRATLLAALARAALAGDLQPHAMEVAEFYRRRAPQGLLAELDALTLPEIVAQSDRLNRQVLGPILAAIGGDLQVLNDIEALFDRLQSVDGSRNLEATVSFSDPWDQGDESLDEPPTEGTPMAEE
jgi:tetratricopeptide (TPR) repeat protein